MRSTRRDESKRRFEIMARQVFIRFKALIMEPAAFAYAERHDNIEAIYKKLEERRDTADVTDLLKELHRIVNEAIRAAAAQATIRREARFFDLSQIDLEKLRDEFAKKVKRKAIGVAGHPADGRGQAGPDARAATRCAWITTGSTRRSSPTTTARRTASPSRKRSPSSSSLANSLDAEQRRAAEEGLSEDELALFDLLKKDNLSKADRERVKLASQSLLDSVRRLIAPLGALDRERADPGGGGGLHSRPRLPRRCPRRRSPTMKSRRLQNGPTSTSGSKARPALSMQRS